MYCCLLYGIQVPDISLYRYYIPQQVPYLARHKPSMKVPLLDMLKRLPRKHTAVTQAIDTDIEHFWTHTSALCLIFGVLCFLVNSRLNDMFQANLQTAEAQLFTRHFGIGMILVAYLCHATLAAGHVTPDMTFALIIYHGTVLCAFAFEFGVKKVWRSAPVFTLVAAWGGLLLHAIVFVEGFSLRQVDAMSWLSELGGAQHTPGEDDPDWLRQAAVECELHVRVMIGITAAASYAVIYDPPGRYLLRHRRSINSGHPPVAYYWPCVLGSLAQIATWIAASTFFLPRLPNVHYRASEVSLLSTVFAIPACMLIAEFGFYWTHRAFHTRLLYRHFHVLHHRIESPTSAYDALYQDPVEFETNLICTYLPLYIVPIHIGAVAIYLFSSGFIAFVLNHSGREASVTLPAPFREKGIMEVWSTELHDKHHFFRRGNYGAQSWLFDELFGTAIRLRKPMTRSQRRWAGIRGMERVVFQLISKSPMVNELVDSPIIKGARKWVKHTLSADVDGIRENRMLDDEYYVKSE